MPNSPTCANKLTRSSIIECQDLQAWLLRTYRVAYSRSGLTDLLHRLGFTYQLTTPVPCQADAAAQADFLAKLAVLEAHVARGEAVLYYADAAHSTHNTRCPRAWCAVGQQRSPLTGSGLRSEEAQAKEAGHKARRWFVERTHSWRNRFRHLLVRWAKKPENYLAMQHFACARTTWYKCLSE